MWVPGRARRDEKLKEEARMRGMTIKAPGSWPWLFAVSNSKGHRLAYDRSLRKAIWRAIYAEEFPPGPSKEERRAERQAREWGL